jgi:hypothetical protein
MTDELNLFAADDEAGSAIDADIALITVYLAREMSFGQIVAVDERLANDRAFREKVLPIIEAWTLPVSFDARRETASPQARAHPLPSPGVTSTRERRPSMTRIAATIALILLPLVGSAQLAIYIAKRAGGSGQQRAPSPPSSDGERDLSILGTSRGETVLRNDVPLAAPPEQRAETTVVRAGAPIHPGVGSVTEELIVGRGSNAPEYQFTFVKLWPAPAGGVFVMNVDNPLAPGPPFLMTVRQFDRAGRFVRAFGRSGQGPGEFTGTIRDVAHLPDGRILVLDSRGVLVYSPTGEPLDRWPAGRRASRLDVDPSGFVLVRGDSQVASPEGPVGPRRPFVARFGFDGTLNTPGGTPPDRAAPDVPRVGSVALPFAPRQVVAWSPLGYFVTAFTGSYAVDMRLPRPGAPRSGALWADGDPVRSIRRTPPPVPVGHRESADWEQSIVWYHRSGRSSPNWEWTGPRIPTVKPPILDLLISAEGRIWVRISQPGRLDSSVPIRSSRANPNEWNEVDAPRRWPEPWVFDVFEPTGVYVGQVRLPDDAGPPHLSHPGYAIQGDTIWGVVHDQDGVPSVRRYRVRWPR